MSGDVVHSLGATMVVAGAALYLARALVGARRERAVLRRFRELLASTERERPKDSPVRAWLLRRRADGLRDGWVPVVAAGLGAAVLVGGGPGCVAGAGAAYAIRRWQRRPRTDSGADAATARQLPLAADLMAACLTAGAGPGEAADAVGRSLGGPLGGALLRVAAELRLGGDPAECWGRFGACAYGLGRCLERASTTGVPPVDDVARLAAGYRAERGRSALARARRAGVLATAPLGLCFLPAFLLIGVAPVVLGLAGTILAGGTG